MPCGRPAGCPGSGAQLAGTGITPIFPLWRRPTALLAHPLEVIIGRTVERDGFVFTDVLPTAQAYQADPGC